MEVVIVDAPPGQKGFAVQPRRWIVERTFTWLARCRMRSGFGGEGLVVAWSRIYLGIHFPLDRAGALVVALVATCAALAIDRRFGLVVTRSLERLFEQLIVQPANWMVRGRG